MRKIIQLHRAGDVHGRAVTLALCDDGTLWALFIQNIGDVSDAEWQRVPSPPDGTEEIYAGLI